jgi:carboxylesterase type B
MLCHTPKYTFFAYAQPSSSSSSSQDYQEADTSSSSFPVRVDLPGLGTIQGVRRFAEDHVVDFFGGIPYAAPPIMSLRWSPPQDVVQWHPHILDASQPGTDCFQMVDPVMNPYANPERMSEDCLYLNIFRPALSKETSLTDNPPHTRLPVMVWFHGGAFQQGGANRPEYDARRLAHEEQVMVVTVNYRLGALGFLVSRELGLTGNYGLMDQRAAMYFVKQYCAYFGGDPNSITLFGESAGAVMIGLHLMMDSTYENDRHGLGDDYGFNEYRTDGKPDNRLFHKAILQSNPMGYQFRSPNVADFLGDALRRAVDCRDLECMKTESVEEILRAQSSLMGIPRSVGDFFAWGPTLTTTTFPTTAQSSRTSSNTFTFSSTSSDSPKSFYYSQQSSSPWQQDDWDLSSVSPFASSSGQFRRRRRRKRRKENPFDVNVTQPLQNLHLIPDDIPIIIGTNKNEGEMFVHGAFPLTMSKAVYWMFVGALFKDSAPKVLKHYRPYVAQLEAEADALAKQQINEEKNKQYFVENQEQLEEEYQDLLATTKTADTAIADNIRGGSQDNLADGLAGSADDVDPQVNDWWKGKLQRKFEQLHNWSNQTKEKMFPTLTPEEIETRRIHKEEQAKLKAKEKALKEAAKVAIDYRPVMSRIINDYLFRCPSWHYAHLLSLQRMNRYKQERVERQKRNRTPSHPYIRDSDTMLRNNVYVYRFSHSTHVPGFLECWGKSCHTAELPFVFEAMAIIRSDYSTLSDIAQKEAPVPPEYPYTDLLAAYRGGLEDSSKSAIVDDGSSNTLSSRLSNYTSYFQRVLNHFFEDYFKEDADEEIAHDMARRWTAFAKTGNPNYEGSKVSWVPWRFVPNKNKAFLLSNSENEIYDVWREIEFQAMDTLDENNIDTNNEEAKVQAIERAHRDHVLRILDMEVVDHDNLRTELKRNKPSNPQSESQYTLSRFGTSSVESGNVSQVENNSLLSFISHSDRMTQQIQQMAQDMGVLGRGLSGDYERLVSGGKIGAGSSNSGSLSGHTYWEDDFFPQLLELQWPPEGRLVERDCTCDFWERIRCRYIQ